jgi:hypothetical protein
MFVSCIENLSVDLLMRQTKRVAKRRQGRSMWLIGFTQRNSLLGEQFPAVRLKWNTIGSATPEPGCKASQYTTEVSEHIRIQ